MKVEMTLEKFKSVTISLNFLAFLMWLIDVVATIFVIFVFKQLPHTTLVGFIQLHLFSLPILMCFALNNVIALMRYIGKISVYYSILCTALILICGVACLWMAIIKVTAIQSLLDGGVIIGVNV